MLLQRDVPLLLTCLALAACTSKADGPSFGDLQPDSLDGSASATNEAGSDDDVVGTDASVEDASKGAAPGHPDAGHPDAGRSTDAARANAANDAQVDDASGANAETGRLEGITAAHNAVRAMVSTQPALPESDLVTNAGRLRASLGDAARQQSLDVREPSAPFRRESQAKNYGENLAAFSARGLPGNVSTAQKAVDGWAAEVMCWMYGTIRGTEQCNMTCTDMLNSDGCGHYTQVVWRKSLELGCGVATCQNGMYTEDIWICNYSPAGNIIGQAPY